MRKLMSATIAAATVAGGALAVGEAAQAQPYGYYPAPAYSAPSSGYYDRYGRWHPTYAPPAYSNGYYPNAYPQTYGSGDPLSSGLAVLGSVLGLNGGYNSYGSNVPVDRYGPDPNGMIAPDGHRIKCKLRTTYDSYYGRSMTRRQCW